MNQILNYLFKNNQIDWKCIEIEQQSNYNI